VSAKSLVLSAGKGGELSLTAFDSLGRAFCEVSESILREKIRKIRQILHFHTSKSSFSGYQAKSLEILVVIGKIGGNFGNGNVPIVFVIWQ
jgi:hypothetical protein